MTPRGAPGRAERGSEAGVELFLEIPSDLRLIEAVVSYLVSRCREFDFEGPRLDLNFRVGLTEALANAVLYGNEGDPEKTVRVEFRIDPRQVEVRVVDEGAGFDPESVPDPTTPDQSYKQSLFCVSSIPERSSLESS